MTTNTVQIDAAFIAELQGFARNGYRFNAEYGLKEGTQQKAFDAYLEGITKGHRHGYVALPTGVGKTAFYLSLIKCYLNAVIGDPVAPRVLINVPRDKLVVQTAKALAKFMPEIAPSSKRTMSREER
jgi:superfamily II DNA or RNA helicase